MEKLDGVRYFGCGHNSEVFADFESSEYCMVCGTSRPVTPIDTECKAYHAEASGELSAHKFVIRETPLDFDKAVEKRAAITEKLVEYLMNVRTECCRAPISVKTICPECKEGFCFHDLLKYVHEVYCTKCATLQTSGLHIPKT